MLQESFAEQNGFVKFSRYGSKILAVKHFHPQNTPSDVTHMFVNEITVTNHKLIESTIHEGPTLHLWDLMDVCLESKDMEIAICSETSSSSDIMIFTKDFAQQLCSLHISGLRAVITLDNNMFATASTDSLQIYKITFIAADHSKLDYELVGETKLYPNSIRLLDSNLIGVFCSTELILCDYEPKPIKVIKSNQHRINCACVWNGKITIGCADGGIRIIEDASKIVCMRSKGVTRNEGEAIRDLAVWRNYLVSADKQGQVCLWDDKGNHLAAEIGSAVMTLTIANDFIFCLTASGRLKSFQCGMPWNVKKLLFLGWLSKGQSPLSVLPKDLIRYIIQIAEPCIPDTPDKNIKIQSSKRPAPPPLRMKGGPLHSGLIIESWIEVVSKLK